MTARDQEKLFKRVQAHFPKWSAQKCSGYLHGIVDEAKYTRPEHPQVKAFSPQRSYAVGYVHGFIDARGIDAFNDPWLKGFKSEHTLRFQWWLNVE